MRPRELRLLAGATLCNPSTIRHTRNIPCITQEPCSTPRHPLNVYAPAVLPYEAAHAGDGEATAARPVALHHLRAGHDALARSESFFRATVTDIPAIVTQRRLPCMFRG